MGKSSKSKSKGGKPKELNDDELLDQAIAENLRIEEERQQQQQQLRATAAVAAQAAGRPSNAQVVRRLDDSGIQLFHIVAVREGNKSGACTSADGEWVFYFDPADAKAAMEERSKTHPGPLAVSFTPLGRAFALSEGWIKPAASDPPPMRLQASQAVLRSFGGKVCHDLCPPKIREQMNPRTSPLPVFTLSELQDEASGATPFFFSRNDMTRRWVEKTGKPVAAVPEHATLSDLRVLVVRMLTNARDWETLQLVPDQQVSARIEKQRKAREAEAAAARAAEAAAISLRPAASLRPATNSQSARDGSDASPEEAKEAGVAAEETEAATEEALAAAVETGSPRPPRAADTSFEMWAAANGISPLGFGMPTVF